MANSVPAHHSATQRFEVTHETVYDYAYPATLSQQRLHLTPRDFDFQRCEAHRIDISPTPDETHQAIDYFGNFSQYLALTQPHQSLTVVARSTIELLQRPCESLIAHSVPWETLRDDLRSVGDPTRLEPIKYLYESPHVALSEGLVHYARASFTPHATVLAAAFDLTVRIHREFTFDANATDISTPLSELLSLKRGVCQDFAHFMIGCLRSIGVPCRYMSGYILTHPSPGKPRLIGADASHAWVSVYCPSIGWVDFDPTNRCMVNLEHITLGWGRDFSDVTLLQGVMLGGGEQTLKVSVTVMPLA